jgi:hypothetical protein
MTFDIVTIPWDGAAGDGRRRPRPALMGRYTWRPGPRFHDDRHRVVDDVPWRRAWMVPTDPIRALDGIEAE